MKKNTSKTKQISSGRRVQIQPLADRILVRPFSAEEIVGTTVSGIIIPDTLDKEKPAQGEVIAVGPGKYEDGTQVPMHISVGDTVVFSKYGYDEITVEGEEYYILKEDNILAILK